ncbi:MAG: hypothetical protein GF317_24305 [Candidatus Lokiarchaeota archaeon]|nr:hypothetical protein [Candidatus Lokiarchaeota archaeon]MBD3202497.1 hypothetical protein [Candidatus Lokiarchaeota archaeon]
MSSIAKNRYIIIRRISFFIAFSINLFIAYSIGYLISLNESIIYNLIGLIIIPFTLIINYFLVQFYQREKRFNSIFKRKFMIFTFISINLLFAFSIGLTIPIMESVSRFNFGIVMIPLLIILNYITMLRYDNYLDKEVMDPNKKESEALLNPKNRPIIEFEGKKYLFSLNSLILLFVGAPLLTVIIYFFFDLKINYWLHEIVVKQTTLFLNLLFDMGAETQYLIAGKYHWNFIIPGRASIYFETFCTGIQAICVFAGIIIFTPHSKDPLTKRDIIWRKTKSLIVSSVIFYVVNVIRMLIQIYLYFIGYRWADIHYSISAASSFIAAIIVLLMHKWIPEFIISLIYTYTLIKTFIKKKLKSNSKIDAKAKRDKNKN